MLSPGRWSGREGRAGGLVAPTPAPPDAVGEIPVTVGRANFSVAGGSGCKACPPRAGVPARPTRGRPAGGAGGWRSPAPGSGALACCAPPRKAMATATTSPRAARQPPVTAAAGTHGRAVAGWSPVPGPFLQRLFIVSITGLQSLGKGR